MPLVFPTGAVAQDSQNNLGLFKRNIERSVANALRSENYLFDNCADFIRVDLDLRDAGIANPLVKHWLRSAKHGSCFPSRTRSRLPQKTALARTEKGSDKDERDNHQVGNY
jgi:hypothetical protein